MKKVAAAVDVGREKVKAKEKMGGIRLDESGDAGREEVE